jgi:Leucine-rich repeat (LRR) protein/GTPase SAR1 family protein
MSDLDIIKQIEKTLNVKLKEVKIIEWESQCYVLNQNGEVSALGLDDCNIINLKSIIYLLKDLKYLSELDLRKNELENISHLKELMNLTSLNLSLNKLTDISPLKEFVNLSSLNLSSNYLSDISPLKDLKNLTILDLGYNPLGDISLLKKLVNLSSLDLSYNHNSDISPIKELVNLSNLCLSSNQLSDISFLKDLKNLKTLDLRFNRLSNISQLEKLVNISDLDLGKNQISDISPLEKLVNLSYLTLSQNQFNDISPLINLPKLASLHLAENNIYDLSQLKYLKQIKQLYLYNNKVRDISPLCNLNQLDWLVLDDNKIEDITPLNELTELEGLLIKKNKIKDITPLKNLKKLSRLNLEENPIEVLPPWITDFNMEIKWEDNHETGFIYFLNNPLKTPPPEIVKEGKTAIRNYFEQLKLQGKDNIYEAKLMLVGEPGSGKTTLMNLLFNKNFPVPNKHQKSTLGIEVRQNWGFKMDDKSDFKANIWDFGGQQIQYMLHQFFLTSDCLYVLMAEKRRELANFDYWLNIINVLGKNSPVVTLFNEINIDSVSSFIYDEKKYKNLFPELSLQRLDVNLGEIKDGRFETLLNTIKKKISKLELIGKEVPARWVDIRKELEKRRKNRHIHINEYFTICRNFDIEKEEDQMLILKYFHLLGIVLHFNEDENLCDTLFLDPNWTVDAIYSILSNKDIEKSYGFINKSDIDKIWNEKGYGFEERAKLLQLMLKNNFELCYKLPGTQDKYIVPLLLSPQKPDYDWDNNNNLQFRFQYPFMPKGIVSRLIVRMHKNIDQSKVWSEGVIFKKNGAMAQVIEKKTMKEGLKIIEIRLSGTPPSRKDFLTLIREEIKNIQNSSFPNLPYNEMIPCHCKECERTEDPYFFDYSDIETYLQKGKTKIDCRKSTEEVSIIDLVGSIFNTKEIEERYKRIMDEGKININLNNIGNPQVNVSQVATLIATQQQTVTQNVKAVQGLFKNLKDDILDEVEIEMKDEKEKKRIKNELEKVDEAFSELEKAASEGKKEIPENTKSRIGEFIDNLSDENSRINKALKLVSNGAEKVQKLGRIYNQFAPYFVLPVIPPVLLGKEK